jgi:hypothetical protein
MKSRELVSLMSDAFFTEEMAAGCTFYVRRTDVMREARTMHILDEIEEKLKSDKAFEEVEAKRDMTYAEFMTQYLDHIEGKVDPDLRQDRPTTAEEGSPEKQMIVQPDDVKEEGEDEESKLDKSVISNQSKKKEVKEATQDDIDLRDDIYHNLTDSCYLNLLKGCKIEKLDKKFVLIGHPYPSIEGEMLLF